MDLQITDTTTRQFAEALLGLETSGDTAPMGALFTDDAPVLSIDGGPDRTGPSGIEELFTTYLAQFDRVRTTFTAVTEGTGRSALEWRSEATVLGGRDVVYLGVTIIDLEGEKVSGFRTVYDSAALLDRPEA